MKDCEDGSSPVNPLEAEGNIYQHARQSIEGNENCLTPQLAAYLGTDDFYVADCKSAENVIVFQRAKHRRGYPIYVRKLINICQHAVFVAITVVQNFLGQLRITVTGVSRK